MAATDTDLNQANALGELIAQTHANNPPEKRAVRNMPRDHDATKALRADENRMDALADLADVPRDRLIDAAVRGGCVTFVVVDEDGVPSDGFFELDELPPASPTADRDAGEADEASADRIAQLEREARARDEEHRRAMDAERARADEAASESERLREQLAGAEHLASAAGIPASFGELTGQQVVDLLKSPGPGVEPLAVVRAEFAREGGPREAVRRAAKGAGLLDDDGNPRPSTTPEAPAEPPPA